MLPRNDLSTQRNLCDGSQRGHDKKPPTISRVPAVGAIVSDLEIPIITITHTRSLDFRLHLAT